MENSFGVIPVTRLKNRLKLLTVGKCSISLVSPSE